MIRALTFALLCLGGAAAAQTRNDAFAPAPGSEGASGRGAVLRGLDKISGEVQDMTLAVGDTLSFHHLTVALTGDSPPSGISSAGRSRRSRPWSLSETGAYW